MTEEVKNEDLSKLSFEDALIQLENIVRELESGRIKLDDAVSAYEKAVTLKKLCQDKLNAAALKVEKKIDKSVKNNTFFFKISPKS